MSDNYARYVVRSLVGDQKPPDYVDSKSKLKRYNAIQEAQGEQTSPAFYGQAPRNWVQKISEPSAKDIETYGNYQRPDPFGLSEDYRQKNEPVFNAVFPGKTMEQVITSYRQDETAFMQGLFDTGRNPDTESFMKAFFPEITNEQIDEFYAPPEKKGLFDDMPPEGRNIPTTDGKNLTVMPDGKAYINGEHVGAVNQTTEEFIPLEPTLMQKARQSFMDGLAKASDIAQWPSRTIASGLMAPIYTLAHPDSETAKTYQEGMRGLVEEKGIAGALNPIETTKFFAPGGEGFEAYAQMDVPAGVRGGVEMAIDAVMTMGLSSAATALKPILYRSLVHRSPTAARLAFKAAAIPGSIDAVTSKIISKATKPISNKAKSWALDKVRKATLDMFADAKTADDYARIVSSDDFTRRLTEKLGKNKLAGRLIRIINPSALKQDEVNRLLLGDIFFREEKYGQFLASMEHLETFGDEMKLLGNPTKNGLMKTSLTDAGIAAKYQLTDGTLAAIPDVIEHLDWFNLTPEQISFMKIAQEISDTIGKLLSKEGIIFAKADLYPGGKWFHRMQVGKATTADLVQEVTEEAAERTAAERVAKAGATGHRTRQGLQFEREYPWAIEGINKGRAYNSSIKQTLFDYYQQAIELISEHRMFTNPAMKGLTATQRVKPSFANRVQNITQATQHYADVAGSLELIAKRNSLPKHLYDKLMKADSRIAAMVKDLFSSSTEAKARKQALTQMAEQARARHTRVNGILTPLHEKLAEAVNKAAIPSADETYMKGFQFAEGKIFPKETAARLEKYYTEQMPKILQMTSGASSITRTLITSLDFSAWLLQGLPLLGHSPAKWAQVSARMFASFFKPSSHIGRMAAKSNTIARMKQFGTAYFGREAHEFVEGVPIVSRWLDRGGPFGRMLKKVFDKTYGKAEFIFTAFGDDARVALWESLETQFAKNGNAGLYELGRLINHMTGTMNTKQLGLSATQRGLESSFVFFAPSYTRAGFALVGDIFKGGYTTQHALRSIAGFISGGITFYLGACAASGQEPQLDPSKSSFCTLKAGDRHIGIGGFLYSLTRFAADLSASITGKDGNELADLVKFNPWSEALKDNPTIKFMYSRSAPLTKLLNEGIMRRDFMGESLETPEQYARWLGSFVTPISFQGLLLEDPRINLPGFITEMLGGRTYPAGVREKLNELRDSSSMEDFGLPYAKLGRDQRLILEKNHPELQTLAARADAEWAAAYPNDERVKYDNDTNAAREDYWTEINLGVAAVMAGAKTLYAVSKDWDDAGLTMSTLIEDAKKRYPQAIQAIEAWAASDENKADWTLFDYAYSDYITSLVAKNFDDEFGNTDYTARDKAFEEYELRWGDVLTNAVKDYLWYKDDAPELFLERKAAGESWSPYYAIPDTDKEARISYRRSHSETEAYLYVFGRIEVLENPNSPKVILAMMDKYNLPPEAIRAFSIDSSRYTRMQKYVETGNAQYGQGLFSYAAFNDITGRKKRDPAFDWPTLEIDKS